VRTTASKAGLVQACGWWARPEAEWATSTSAAADRGNRFHAAIANYVECGDLDRSDLEDLVGVAAKWVDNYGRGLIEAEVAFSYDPATDTATRLDIVDREYPDDGLLHGSADLVSVSRVTRTGYVGDWKTGDASNAGPQLRALALMLARTEDLDSVTVEALEVSESGVRSVCREDLDAFALAAIAGELAEALAAVPTAEPVPGSHCGELYCPARVACPAGLAIVAQVIPASALVRHGWGITIASPDHAAWLLEHAKLVGKAADDVKEAVKAYVPRDGLVLEDGSLLVEGTRNMPRRDGKKLEALARACGATEEQIAGCDYIAVESSGLKVKKAAKARKKAA